MNGYVDTREGWRELDVVTPDSIYQLAEYDPADGSVVRAWVREAPVPPLPTAPYTVIRVQWREDESEGLEPVLVRGDEQWSAIEVDQWHSAAHIAEHIAGFEVLAEPRAVTAKAVLDQIQECLPLGFDDPSRVQLTGIAREFGVSS